MYVCARMREHVIVYTSNNAVPIGHLKHCSGIDAAIANIHPATCNLYY